MTPNAYCEQIAKASGSNFYLAFNFLPRERRSALCALYAFCRTVDDIADGPLSVDEKRKHLEKWHHRIDSLFAGNPDNTIANAIAQYAEPFALPEKYFHDIIDGAEMDLVKNRYATFDELYHYCFRVASAVGLIAIQIFGCKTTQAKIYAENLGLAFQLTNIMRDVAADAKEDRIYLPQEDLDRFQYAEDKLLRQVHDSSFEALMKFQAERARSYFGKAEREMPAADKKALLPARVMEATYSRLLKRIEASGFDIFTQRQSLSFTRKMMTLIPFSVQMLRFPWTRESLS